MSSSAYRTFEHFPLPWKAPDWLARFVQLWFIIALLFLGYAVGLLSGSSPATIPEQPPAKPVPVMCYDQILTRPNDNVEHDEFTSYKCPFWDQSQHIITLKGEGVVLCKCPNSKSTP